MVHSARSASFEGSVLLRTSVRLWAFRNQGECVQPALIHESRKICHPVSLEAPRDTAYYVQIARSQSPRMFDVGLNSRN